MRQNDPELPLRPVKKKEMLDRDRFKYGWVNHGLSVGVPVVVYRPWGAPRGGLAKPGDFDDAPGDFDDAPSPPKKQKMTQNVEDEQAGFIAGGGGSQDTLHLPACRPSVPSSTP